MKKTPKDKCGAILGAAAGVVSHPALHQHKNQDRTKWLEDVGITSI
jgi:hypothetical protein